MQKTNRLDKKDAILTVALLSCVLFTVFSLLFNVFYSMILWPLLPNIGINLLTLLIAFIISTIIFIFSYLIKKVIIIRKCNFLTLSTVLYASIFIIFNISTILFKDVWNLYTVLIILAISLIISAIKLYLPVSNYLIKSIIYYVVISIPYFIITLSFAGYDKGNQIIIVFSVYTIVYILANIITFLIISSKKTLENQNKEYKKQFK